MKRALAAVIAFVALATAAAASAAPGRIAVGVLEGVSTDQVALAVTEATGRPVDRELDPLGALVVAVDDVAAAVPVLQSIPGVAYVEPVTKSRSLAFKPTDPLVDAQWYLPAIRAFDFWPDAVPQLSPVRVAVVDSGIDATHPEFDGRIAGGESFVGSDWRRDTMGHGTFVAGEIAAALDNGQGIAGVGFPVSLLIAKVTDARGSISVEAEAKAIRWAVDRGARVINLSLGGPRDPNDPTVDTYSPLEEAAIRYAASHGVTVVAAVGNCEQRCPGRYASYPAALSHVIGVSAIRADGTAAPFSNRDGVFNDIAAPGFGIISTLPLDLAPSTPGCPAAGYSICGPESFKDGAGTSFAAPLVSAAAALLVAQDPRLTPSQVTQILTQTASDMSSAGRDAVTGSGRLDVTAALEAVFSQPLPPSDRFESNDDAGTESWRIPLRSSRLVIATVDAYDDPTDVYRVYLRAGRRFRAVLESSFSGKPTLVLWRPGTRHVSPVTRVALRTGSILAWRRARVPVIDFVVRRAGWYFVEVKAPPRSGGPYRLFLESRPRG